MNLCMGSYFPFTLCVKLLGMFPFIYFYGQHQKLKTELAEGLLFTLISY